MLLETESNNVSRFMQLPDELQIKILGELPVQDLLKSTVVCHKWKNLVYDGSLWATINVAPFYKTISMEQILKLIKCSCRFLKSANFRGCIQLTGHGLRTLSDNCPNLEVLIIKDCRGLSAASLGYFLQRANQLKILDVSGLDTIKTSTLLSITSLDKLEKLNMSWCKNITGPGILSMVSASSQRLTCLKLNGCPQLDDNTMSSLGTYSPNLTRLCLAACTSLSDSAILAFFKSSSSSKKLTHLNISSCARLTDVTLRNLAIYAPHLKHLELAGCLLMTDQGFLFMTARLRTLVHLDLEDVQQITGVTVKSIANHQPDLKWLCLNNCNHISDEAVVHLILQGICRKLQHLELDNCTVTDKALEMIANYLQKQHLKRRLSDITASSTESGVSLYTPSTLLSEESLENQKEELDDRRITLEVLDCSNISEKGIRQALAKAGPLLTIKSFYSFQDDQEEDTTQQHDEESADNIHRHSRSNSSSSRYNVMGNRRRRGHVAGQRSSSSSNCIIL